VTTYFSLIEPTQGNERAAAHERAVGPYGDHQWLWRFLPADAGTPRDFLFRRLDAEATSRFYVVSSRRPKQLSDSWRVESREYEPKLLLGERLRFDLRANPVVTHARDGKTKRHDVVMQAKKALLDERGLETWEQWKGGDKPQLYELVRESCLRWLVARGQRLGFATDEEGLSVDGYAQHRGKQDQIRFSTVDFSGEITVTDPGALAETLVLGIGHAKAFGCGLLLVRRVTG
jgi:CRISPR system Cascade subunit CasE